MLAAGLPGGKGAKPPGWGRMTVLRDTHELGFECNAIAVNKPT